MVVEPGKQAGAECVAGADRIDDVNHWRGDLGFRAGADPEGPVGPQGHHDQAGAASQKRVGGRLQIELRIEPRDVGITRLDDRALRDDRLHPLAIAGRAVQQHGPDVWINHDQPVAVLAPDQPGDRRGHWFQYQPEGADVKGRDNRRKRGRQHLRRQVGCRGPVDHEPVRGVAIAVDLGHCQGGGLWTEARERQVGAVALEQVAELLAECIRG